MVHMERHARELFWLERRIQVLKDIDRYRCGKWPSSRVFPGEYDSVSQPTGLMDRLKEIYGDDLIDPDWRKPKSTTTTTTQTDAITKAVMARMAPQTDEGKPI